MQRRIMFDKNNGKILIMEVANNLIPNENIGMILQDSSIDKEKFDSCNEISVDTKTNTIIFGEMKQKEKSDKEKIQDLENKLLQQEELI